MEFGDKKLEVEGKNAGSRAKVSLWDAESGGLLGTTRAQKSGEWKVLIRRLKSAPASVKFTSGKRSAFSRR